LKFIIKNYPVRGAEVRNRNSGARCECVWCGTGLQMVRRCAVWNRLVGAGAHHCAKDNHSNLI